MQRDVIDVLLKHGARMDRPGTGGNRQPLVRACLANRMLVEGLEEEIGERTVGFRIEDEDLEDLKTVRDAVDYVVGRL